MILGALLALSLQTVVPVQAFALDTVPAHLDSVVARSRRDTTIQTLKQPGLIIWSTPYANRRHLQDSLNVWCTGSCRWEWDGVQDAPQDATASLPGTTWGVQAVGAPAAWAMGATGQGIKVASLDSGIDPNHLGYVVGGGYAATGTGFGGTTTWYDDIPSCNGHGTHVGGTMADSTGRGVARKATLYGIKVFSEVNGQCLAYTSSQIAGIDWAVANGVRCINISIGGGNTSAAMQNTIASARNAGVVIAAANGNAGSTPAMFPGRADYLLGVASVNSGLIRSGFSNYGPTTDLSGPGEGVESTMPGGGYGTKSGTSMATPHVAGACAVVLSDTPTLTADSVMNLLKATAQPLGDRPNDYTGWGLVRVDRAIAALHGGAEVAGPKVDTFTALSPVTRCAPVVAIRPWTATSTDSGVTIQTTADQLCITVDPARAPSAITVTLR